MDQVELNRLRSALNTQADLIQKIEKRVSDVENGTSRPEETIEMIGQTEALISEIEGNTEFLSSDDENYLETDDIVAALESRRQNQQAELKKIEF